MNFKKYNPTQLKVLACMAWYCHSLYTKATQPDQRTNEEEREIYRSAIDGIAFTAAHIGISDNDLQAVRNGHIKGLQNLNRIATVIFWDDNFQFDFMGKYDRLFYAGLIETTK